MTTPVTFHIAKILKEKGFANTTPHKLNRSYYNHLGELNGDVTEYIKAIVRKTSTEGLETIDAPTIGKVIMWLYKKHKIWLHASITLQRKFYYECYDLSLALNVNNYPEVVSKPGKYFESPTEAYLTAIELTLTNLI